MWNMMEYVAPLLGITAAFVYLNHYLVGLPRNTGLLELLHQNRGSMDFSGLLLNGFLGFLLFAMALDADVKALYARKWTILALATVGVLLSAFGMGGGMYAAFDLTGVAMPLSWCLAFGALISPTDPVTVLGVLRRAGLPGRLQVLIAGEPLLNDGVGIVLYSMFLAVATGAESHFGALSSFLFFRARPAAVRCSASSWAGLPSSPFAALMNTTSSC